MNDTTIVNQVYTCLQAPSFRLAVKRRLLDLEMTVTELAGRLGLSRTAVSLAINHESLFPGVKERIREVLEMGEDGSR